MSVDEARVAVRGLKKAGALLETLSGLGLGYLTLGEATPALSGGEAQRLKLASEMGRRQDGTLFVFDEPTIGLHPDDVQVLIDVLQHLIERGATVLVIEHDLDLIRCADWVIDMGPGGGIEGGRIVAQGTPTDIAAYSGLGDGAVTCADWGIITGWWPCPPFHAHVNPIGGSVGGVPILPLAVPSSAWRGGAVPFVSLWCDSA